MDDLGKGSAAPQMTGRRRWALLATVGAGLLLITLDNSILYTALPTLTSELDATGAQSLWVINAYPVVMAGLLLGSGSLGDRVGHRKMFTIGLVIFGLSSLLAAFSPTIEVLIGARAVLAVGAAAMMPATLSLVRISFQDERERNIAIAVWGSLSIVGAALGPIVGGALLEYFWWGSVFLINIPVVIAALIATAIIAPPNRADRAEHWDLVSSVQVMVGLVGAVFLLKEVATTSPRWSVVGVALAASVVGFVLFARRQRRLPDPLLDFGLFRNNAFLAGVLAAGLGMFTIGGLQLASTQRFQLVAGFTPLEAGLLVSVIAAGSLPTAMIGGAILHRTGLRPLIGGGFGVSFLGAVVSVIGFTTGFAWLVVGFFLTGAGLGLVLAVASTAIVGNVPARKAGMASSVEEVSYEFGNLTAVALIGSLLTLVYSLSVRMPAGTAEAASESMADALQVAGDDPAAISAAQSAFDVSYVVVMCVIAGLLLLGTLVTTWLLRRHGPGSQSQLSAEEAYADAPHPTPVRETRPDAYAGTRAIRQSVQSAGGAGVGSVGRERSHRHG